MEQKNYVFGGRAYPETRAEYVLGLDVTSLLNKKIMLYGDSIFSTDYDFLKAELERASGASVYNGGFSGYSTASLASSTCLQRVVDYDPDIVVIMVGGNDSGVSGTVGTFGTYGGLLSDEAIKDIPSIDEPYIGNSYIEAASYIANFLTYKIGGFRHNNFIQGKCTDVGNILSNESDLDEVKKPFVLVCTPLPQQRESNSNNFSSPKNNKRKADAIREMCQLCNIPMLDLAVLSGLSRINEPFYTSPTDKTHNKGTLTMDGLHPNKYGYRRIAKLIINFINQCF